ncbi:MAG: MarR family transcriptional regulator [Alphaproteobacteria bacterium]|jgi:DNA-binding MarR family transcriptional regulator|nr:MarR family transcriptional regulator [Alphaproteobacteria bacterium]
MSDVKAGPNPLFLTEEELRQALELVFLAQRHVSADVDALLGKRGLGRAHHRALYFIGRYPRISVGGLLDLLGITKQSLSRVLTELIDRGYVASRAGATDRRQKQLVLTEAGAELERLLYEAQRRRIARAYRQAGAEAVEGFRTVLEGMIEAGGAGSAPRKSPEAARTTPSKRQGR